MLFKYQAQAQGGEMIEGEAEALDKFSLAETLKKKQYKVILVKEAYSAQPFFKRYIKEIFGIIRPSEKIIFAKSFGAMLKAGLSVSRALAVLKRQAQNKAFQIVIQSIEHDIERGISLKDAFSRFPKLFPPLVIAIVASGEQSGRLPESFTLIGEHLEKNYEIVKRVQGALIYPVIIICATFGVGILMLVYMVPTLTATFKELHVELPLPTKIIIGVSDLFVNYALFFVLLFAVVIFILISFFRSSRGRRFIDFVFLKTPVISEITREINGARIARTLSSLLSSGITIVNALYIAEDVVQNSYYKKTLKEARRLLESGHQLSLIFSKTSALYQPLVTEMVAVGEETGKLPEMLLNLAVFYENEIAQKTKDMSTIIEPVLMIIIGIAVGLFAVSMIIPLYSIVGSV